MIMATMTTPIERNNSNLVVDIVSAISTHAVLILKFVHKNAWTIVFLIAGGYFCFNQCECTECVKRALSFVSV